MYQHCLANYKLGRKTCNILNGFKAFRCNETSCLANGIKIKSFKAENNDIFENNHIQAMLANKIIKWVMVGNRKL